MIKDNLVCLRKINGYSQEEIAEKIGISRQAYGKWEKGETVPDVEKCGLLASFYGITIDDLVHTNRGQIVIPQQARMIFEIKGGDRLVVLGDEAEGIALVKEKTFMDRMNMAMKFASNELPDDMEEERNG